MAVQRRQNASMETVFPFGAFLPAGEEVRPVFDFNAPQRPDGSRPQQVDAETGQPMWSITVFDNDPEARGKEKAVVVKIAAQHQPVPPENTSGLPFTPVAFEGLTVTAWVDKNGSFPKLAWSIKATDFAEVGTVRSTSAREAQGA
ncbi:hypothetical protein GCM10027030_07930 [Luteococcus sediminum]